MGACDRTLIDGASQYCCAVVLHSGEYGRRPNAAPLLHDHALSCLTADRPAWHHWRGRGSVAACLSRTDTIANAHGIEHPVTCHVLSKAATIKDPQLKAVEPGKRQVAFRLLSGSVGGCGTDCKLLTGLAFGQRANHHTATVAASALGRCSMQMDVAPAGALRRQADRCISTTRPCEGCACSVLPPSARDPPRAARPHLRSTCRIRAVPPGRQQSQRLGARQHAGVEAPEREQPPLAAPAAPQRGDRGAGPSRQRRFEPAHVDIPQTREEALVLLEQLQQVRASAAMCRK